MKQITIILLITLLMSNMQLFAITQVTTERERQTYTAHSLPSHSMGRRKNRMRRCCKRYHRATYGRRYRYYGKPVSMGRTRYWNYYGWPAYYDYGIYGGVGFGGRFYI